MLAPLRTQVRPKVPPPMPNLQLQPAGGTSRSTTSAFALIVMPFGPSLNWVDPLCVTMRPFRLRTHRLRSPRRAVLPRDPPFSRYLHLHLNFVYYFFFYFQYHSLYLIHIPSTCVFWCPGVARVSWSDTAVGTLLLALRALI